MAVWESYAWVQVEEEYSYGPKVDEMWGRALDSSGSGEDLEMVSCV